MGVLIPVGVIATAATALIVTTAVDKAKKAKLCYLSIIIQREEEGGPTYATCDREDGEAVQKGSEVKITFTFSEGHTISWTHTCVQINGNVVQRDTGNFTYTEDGNKGIFTFPAEKTKDAESLSISLSTYNPSSF